MINPKFVTMVSSRDKNEQQVRVEDLAIFFYISLLKFVVKYRGFFLFCMSELFYSKKRSSCFN